MSRINTAVQPFKTEAFHNGKFIEVTEQACPGAIPGPSLGSPGPVPGQSRACPWAL